MNKSEVGKLGFLKSLNTRSMQKQERISLYEQNPTFCQECGKMLSYKDRHKKFCNNSCSAKYSNKRRFVKYPIKEIIQINGEAKVIRDYGNCVYCGKPLTHKGKYCNNKCKGKHESSVKYNNEISLWKEGKLDKTYNTIGNVIKSIKKYLLIKYDNKCAICGWCEINKYTGKSPLEVHHIDGNWENNVEENLIILCPNCHSLTKSYKASNKGNGRPKRK